MASALTFRPATKADVPLLVHLLADDPFGATREADVSPLPDSYYQAYAAISGDPHNELVVAELAGELVGMLQLTFIPSLSYQGSWRAQIEGVRVAAAHRSQGIGRRLFAWAIDRARSRGCRLVQLTSDKARADAIRFYETLGFRASHEGLKLHLETNA